MNSKSPSFKLGVLNMTISFDTPQFKRRGEGRMDSQNLKVSQINNFVTRYQDLVPRINTIAPKKQENNPYQSYRRHRKESIRYFREHSEEVQKSKNILGFHPIQNKTIQMEFNQPFHLQDKLNSVNPVKKDSHLSRIFNKRHLKQKKSPEHRSPRTQRLAFQFQVNPERSLQNIFTVRQIKTSVKTARNSHERHDKMHLRVPITRQEHRSSRNQEKTMVESTDKKIRPWSPTRNPFNKQTFLQSTFLEVSAYPEGEVSL